MAGGMTDDELLAEVARRGLGPRCTCKRWTTYYGVYDADGRTWRCSGCRKATMKCSCR